MGLFKNSYVVAIIIFIILAIIFYIFKIGYHIVVDDDGNIERKYSWKYPLAIALLSWVVLHFLIIPPDSIKKKRLANFNTQMETSTLHSQKIEMDNWN